MLTVRMARTDEFEQVMDFYTQMIDEMRGTDFDVLWEHGIHPSPAFLREAISAGKKAVRLDTFVTNARGRRLYESCGFDCLGTHVLRYGNLGPTAVALYEKAL